MKKATATRISSLPVLCFALGLVLAGLFSETAAADMTLKPQLTFKRDFGPQIMLDQALMNVKIPLNISSMPGPWKTAKFRAITVVAFMDAAGETVGYASSEGGMMDGTLLDLVLDDGGYSGTIILPIRAAAGTITGKTCCTTLVIAELGNQRMYIGSSTGGTAPNSGGCANMAGNNIAPGTVFEY